MRPCDPWLEWPLNFAWRNNVNDELCILFYQHSALFFGAAQSSTIVKLRLILPKIKTFKNWRHSATVFCVQTW